MHPTLISDSSYHFDFRTHGAFMSCKTELATPLVVVIAGQAFDALAVPSLYVNTYPPPQGNLAGRPDNQPAGYDLASREHAARVYLRIHGTPG